MICFDKPDAHFREAVVLLAGVQHPDMYIIASRARHQHHKSLEDKINVIVWTAFTSITYKQGVPALGSHSLSLNSGYCITRGFRDFQTGPTGNLDTLTSACMLLLFTML